MGQMRCRARTRWLCLHRLRPGGRDSRQARLRRAPLLLTPLLLAPLVLTPLLLTPLLLAPLLLAPLLLAMNYTRSRPARPQHRAPPNVTTLSCASHQGPPSLPFRLGPPEAGVPGNVSRVLISSD